MIGTIPLEGASAQTTGRWDFWTKNSSGSPLRAFFSPEQSESLEVLRKENQALLLENQKLNSLFHQQATLIKGQFKELSQATQQQKEVLQQLEKSYGELLVEKKEGVQQQKSLKKRLTSLESNLEAVTEERRQIFFQYQRLQQELEQLSLKQELAEKEQATLLATLEELETVKQGLIHDSQAIHHKLSLAQTQIESLQAKEKRLKEQVEELLQDKKTLEATLKGLEENNHVLRAFLVEVDEKLQLDTIKKMYEIEKDLQNVRKGVSFGLTFSQLGASPFEAFLASAGAYVVLKMASRIDQFFLEFNLQIAIQSSPRRPLAEVYQEIYRIENESGWL